MNAIQAQLTTHLPPFLSLSLFPSPPPSLPPSLPLSLPPSAPPPARTHTDGHTFRADVGGEKRDIAASEQMQVCLKLQAYAAGMQEPPPVLPLY